MSMVEQVMRECHNYFEWCEYYGNTKIKDGVLVGISMDDSEYFAISGSKFNDGVHCGILEKDEEFTGRVWLLHPPKSFIELCERIEAYVKKNPTGSMASENFGTYSYNRGSGSSVTGTAAPWQQAFAFDLKLYRRMFTEVEL